MQKFLKYSLMFFGLLGLDFLTKYLFYTKRLLPEIFPPVLNTGISWSLQVPHRVVYILAAIVTVILVVRLRKPTTKKVEYLAFSFFFAGMLGNIIDRIMLGGVRDFISIGDWFPIFNLADVFLNIAVLLRVWEAFFDQTNKKKNV